MLGEADIEMGPKLKLENWMEGGFHLECSTCLFWFYVFLGFNCELKVFDGSLTDFHHFFGAITSLGPNDDPGCQLG